MTVVIGLGLAVVAMFCWAFGDFLIQKTTRKIGDWETLFAISLFSVLLLLPFVWRLIPSFFSLDLKTFVIVMCVNITLFFSALIDFEALKKGKLSIIEPIWSFEIPAASILAFLIIGEHISVTQIILIVLLVISLCLLAFREKKFSKSFLFEKGVFIAAVGAITMGAAQFFLGWGARVVDPLSINFITDIFMLLGTGLYLFAKGRLFHTFADILSKARLVIPMSVFDKTAWVAYAFSMTLAPIAIATALSESYIIVVVLLGIFLNKEKLYLHQKIGLLGAIMTACVLTFVTSV
jgi:drug/metabolite transporter (DMT)-like permease